MADGVAFDFSELDRLAADLGTVSTNAGPFINSAVQRTSINVKKAAARKVGARKHFKQAAAAIDYEVKTLQAFGTSQVQAEIGFNKDRPAGQLGNLTEFGAPGSRNALTPGNELQSALAENQQDFIEGLDKALGDALRGSGL
jgi:hypothetical protein